MSLFRFGIPAVALLLAVALGGAAAVDPPPVRAPRTHVVVIENMKFTPAVVRIAPGDTVEFRNADLVPHNVTERSAKIFDSGMIARDAVWQLMPARQGVFRYQCIYHPDMTGTIMVGVDADSVAPTAAAAVELCGGS